MRLPMVMPFIILHFIGNQNYAGPVMMSVIRFLSEMEAIRGNILLPELETPHLLLTRMNNFP